MSASPHFSPENIPAFLRQLPQWLNWVLRDVPGTNKPQKIPVRVDGNAVIDAGAATPGTWASFEEVCARVPPATGIGLCPSGLTTADGQWKLILLDLDNVDPGYLLSWFQRADLYMEVSPSGNGVRSAFWLAANHPVAQMSEAYKKISWAQGNVAGQVNIGGGYCTLTGNVLHEGKEQFLSELPFGLTITPTAVASLGTLGAIDWEGEPLPPSGLKGALLSVYNGEGGYDRSEMMLHVLATLSWQCASPEELAGRAWNTEHLHQYFVDHRSQRGEEHQQAFAAAECSKAWPLRDKHKPVELLFDLAQEEVAADEYVYELSLLDNAHMEPPSWLIESVLVSDATMLAGDPEAGKSWLLISFALAVATGRPWMGTNEVKEQGLVVYLASEDKSGVMQRMRSLLKEEKGVPILVHMVEGKLTAERAVKLRAEIAAYCKLLGIKLKLVCVDTYVGYSDVKENAADEVQEFLQRVRSNLCTPFGAALAVAHHLGKDGEVRGSSNLEAYFDLIWSITAAADFTQMRPKKVKQFDRKLVPSHAVQITLDDKGYLEMVKTAGVSATEDSTPDELQVTVDNEVPHWQRVATERLVFALVKDGITSMSRIAKGGEYKLMREQAIAIAKNNRRQHPYPASHTADVVERLVRDGLLVVRSTGRGLELSITEGVVWDAAMEFRRLSASAAFTG